jgi:hypothetical protein
MKIELKQFNISFQSKQTPALTSNMKSVFTDPTLSPTNPQIKEALGSTYPLWEEIAGYTFQVTKGLVGEWKFSGPKYGWSFRISDKRRVILYLLPREHYFKVAFVFGQKATDRILEGKFAKAIKAELQAAKVYAEGRGIRIDIKDNTNTSDIFDLINVKIST